jgi:uncharacterized surface anchored protein
VVIEKVDENQQPLAGACFTLTDGGGVAVGPVCDNDAADGDPTPGVIQIRFVGVRAGFYTLREVQAPPGYQPAPEQLVDVRPGGVTATRIANFRLEPPTGEVEVAKIDIDGAPLGGACFTLIPLTSSGAGIEVCDDAGNDADPTPGVIRFVQVPAGDYRLIETQPPPGFPQAEERVLSVTPGTVTTVTVPNDAFALPVSATPVVAENSY